MLDTFNNQTLGDVKKQTNQFLSFERTNLIEQGVGGGGIQRITHQNMMSNISRT